MAPVTRIIDLKTALQRRAGIEARAFGGGGSRDACRCRGEMSDVAKAVEVAGLLGLDARRPGGAPGDRNDGESALRRRRRAGPHRDGDFERPGTPMRGAHGYPPGEPGMGALLIAAGPGIAPGSRLGAVRALDVAPTLLAWLGIPPPEWMQGRPIAGLVAGEPAPGARRRCAELGEETMTRRSFALPWLLLILCAQFGIAVAQEETDGGATPSCRPQRPGPSRKQRPRPGASPVPRRRPKRRAR